jgi:hypothetical protein
VSGAIAIGQTSLKSHHFSMKPSFPKLLLHAEGLAVLAIACALYARGGFSWGVFAATLLAPDLFMLGYLSSPRVGAFVYNLGHTYLVPLGAAAAFYFAGLTTLYWIPIVWIAHIGLDRFVGYGLRYPTGFKDTHLARA